MNKLTPILSLMLCFFMAQALRLGGWGGESRSRGGRNVVGGIAEVEKELIKAVEVLERRGADVKKNPAVFAKIEESIAELERSTMDKKRSYNPVDDPSLEGTWKLLYTSSPGTNSPIQRTLTGYDGVSVYQVVNIRDYSKNSFLTPKVPDVSNTVVIDNFAGGARLRVTAEASTENDRRVVPRVGDGAILGAYPFGKSSSEPPRRDSERIDFAFQEAKLEACGFPEGFYLPYPVPFKLLGDEAKGWLDITYISDRFRISRGNKGTCFLLLKVDEASDRRAAIATAQTKDLKRIAPQPQPQGRGQGKAGTGAGASAPLAASSTRTKTKAKGKGKVVLVFPQQFGCQGDYEDLRSSLEQRMNDKDNGGGKVSVVTVPLTRLDWPLGLVPSFFSPEYREGRLTPRQTLGFYFTAVDKAVVSALSALDVSVEEADISIVSHSIGGWVARAWLSEWCSSEVRRRVVSLVTLGSPHNEPPEGTLMAKLDQTRGLLKYINSNYPGAHLASAGVRYTSVISNAVPGGGGGGEWEEGSGLLPSLLAYGSYLALGGDGTASGDGIIPVPTSILEGATNILLSKEDEGGLGPVYHSNFVGPVVLKGLPWYGTEKVVDRWIGFL